LYELLPLLLHFVQVDNVHDLRDAEPAAPVGPHHFVLEKLGRFANSGPNKL
jgi:hypothetical protein